MAYTIPASNIVSANWDNPSKFEQLGMITIDGTYQMSLWSGFKTSVFQKFTGIFGGTNTQFQEYVNKFRADAHKNFLQQVILNYPMTTHISNYHSNIAAINEGSNKQLSCITISGTCWRQIDIQNQEGGKTRSRRRKGRTMRLRPRPRLRN